MTSKSKEAIDNTLQLSLDENIEAKVQPSKPLASSDNTQTSMQILNKPSPPMLSTVKNVSEKSRQHSILLKVLLSNLESAGLIRRFKVLSKNGEWMETQIVFDNSLWDENLDLKVLSSLTTED